MIMKNLNDEAAFTNEEWAARDSEAEGIQENREAGKMTAEELFNALASIIAPVVNKKK